MRRTALIIAAMAVFLAACTPTVQSGSVTLPLDECPSAATAALEPAPVDPIASEAQREAKYAGLIGALGEEVGVAVIEHDDVTVPSRANRGWHRLGEVQRWCRERKPPTP